MHARCLSCARATAPVAPAPRAPPPPPPAARPAPPPRRARPPPRAAAAAAALAPAAAADAPFERWPGVEQRVWAWRGHRVRFLAAGPADGPPVVLVHGFGGNADHWRKNVGPLAAAGLRAYAIDLLGYGLADKPDPRPFGAPNQLYNFENWSVQLQDFLKEVVGGPAALAANSVGGIAALQAAADAPELVRGVLAANITLRALHMSKQAPWARPAVAALQRLLRTTPLGAAFFSAVATRQGVRSVLSEAYGDATAVTEELVDVILTPGLDPAAVHVFLDFISYSSGPLPEELLAAATVPVSLVWGAADPWEKVEWGRELARAAAVEEWVELPGVGHCPQDEAPALVNPLIADFVRRHAPA
jgi:pimeloyl-ACP methyl ester carboxylesterase